MPIKIIELKPSKKENKRYKITIEDNGEQKAYDFGLKGGSTYVDHKDKAKREAYRKRHYANKKEKELIDNLLPSPALFSYYLLWGDKADISNNLNDLQKRFNKNPNKL